MFHLSMTLLLLAVFIILKRLVTIVMSINPEDFMNKTIVDLPPSGIRKYFDLASTLEGCISLGVGEPDFVTPQHIRQACVQSLDEGMTMYTSNSGMPELRDAISNYLEKYDLHYDGAHEILVTVGASEGIDVALRTLVSPGDEVLVPDPSYISYGPITTMCGGVAVAVPTYEKDDFRLSVEALEKVTTPKAKVLIMPYPNNPTGGIMPKEALLPIAEFAQKHNLIIISDEIYSELTYGADHYSIGALPEMKERTLVLNGFSKAFAMTGWRVGYACGPASIITQMTKIHQYTTLCAPIMGQIAALEALKNGENDVKEMVASYDARRRLIVDGFRNLGFDCFEPRGAFYIFPSLKFTGMSSEEFVEKLLLEEKVAVVPGTAFGASGEGFIRCSYASSVENINEALNRIGRFLKNHGISK